MSDESDSVIKNQREIADAAKNGEVDLVDTLLRRNPSELRAGLQSALKGLMLGQLDKPLDDRQLRKFAGLISWAAIASTERKERLPELLRMHKTKLTLDLINDLMCRDDARAHEHAAVPDAAAVVEAASGTSDEVLVLCTVLQGATRRP